ncbi:MAG: phenylalanine--tRNA ligase subunit alpha [Candidatus Eisenbacteria bacterium]
MDLRDEARKAQQTARDEILSSKSLDDLRSLRTKHLGRKGILTLLLRKLGQAAPEERKELGGLLNEAKEELQGLVDSRTDELKQATYASDLTEESLDVTLPGRKFRTGRRNLAVEMMNEIVGVFVGMGFTSVEGPEIETEYNNFDALNFPAWHPSRDDHDSFYVGDGHVLRTHTSPAQIRVMKSQSPPVRVVVPGRCHRRDTPDASHLMSFLQIEGLYVDHDVSMADLKGTLAAFAREIFGEETKVRFRPHFFPFTEPSAELDISCLVCGGKGCRLCKQSGWLEVLGCGMVHPNVYKHVGYDSLGVTGYAFGMGVERVAMLKYGIGDIRMLYDNDLRFLSQF